MGVAFRIGLEQRIHKVAHAYFYKVALLARCDCG